MLAAALLPVGSSPLMRGAQPVHRVPSPRPRIIPACAGNTSSIMPAPQRPWDHPRLCGEHLPCSAVKNTSLGSSPLMRGAQTALTGGRLELGIIPACAGSTHRRRLMGWLAGDHPRLCGEHLSARAVSRIGSGSSPLVRGALAASVLASSLRGIIPACAGSIQRPAASTSARPEHPTCAGNTSPISLASRRSRDHPSLCGEHKRAPVRTMRLRGSSRLCGEHREIERLERQQAGSSPLVRGTPRIMTPTPRHRGIIPACAGNTSFSAPVSSAA